MIHATIWCKDYKFIYLFGDMEEIFMDSLLEFNSFKKKGMQSKKKALYGLKQSPMI